MDERPAGLLGRPTIGGLLSYIDNLKRRVGRNIRDLVDNPNQYMEKVADRLPQTVNQYVNDPGNFIPGGGLAGTFIGKNAKTWNALAEQKAQRMLSEGVPPRAVWKETGVWREPSGNLVQEVSDVDAKLIGTQSPSKVFGDGGVLEHSLFRQSYPELNPNFRVNPLLRGSSYDPVTNSVSSGALNKSETLHELQHAVALKEGLPTGSSLELVQKFIQNKKSELRELENEVSKAGMYAPEEILDMRQQIASLRQMLQSTGGLAGDVYRRHPGEAMARAVERRSGMNQNQLRDVFPEDSYDVPVSELLFPEGLLGRSGP